MLLEQREQRGRQIGDEVGVALGDRPQRVNLATGRMLTFALCEMKNCYRVLSKRVTQSDLFLKASLLLLHQQ